MIRFKKDICDYLRLPDIPKRKWDGKSTFDYGVAVAITSTNEPCYVVVSFDADKDKSPNIKKVFGYNIIKSISEIFVVPAYMNDEDIDDMDLDEESKKRAREIARESAEIENSGNTEEVYVPDNEFYFDAIHDDEEARAFIEAYNRRNKVKGSIPRKHEAIIMRLGVIWAEQNKK